MLRFFLASLVAVLLLSCAKTEEESRVVSDFTQNWRFALVDSIHNRDQHHLPELDDSDWRSLNLPHDWLIEEGGYGQDNLTTKATDTSRQKNGWYRKRFNVTERGSDKLFFIDFDGVCGVVDVWINGHHLGKKFDGHKPLRYDLTPHLNFGTNSNLIAVKIESQQTTISDSYIGAGICRNVWLTSVNPLHVADNGVLITTRKVTESGTMVNAEHVIRNASVVDQKYKLITDIVSPDGNIEASVGTGVVGLKAGEKTTITLSAIVEDPQLWTPEKPVLYKAVVKIVNKDKLIDRYIVKFGIRHFQYDREKGFLLNGEKLKIKGVSFYQNYSPLGAVENRRVLKRKLKIVKEMGANTIRTANKPLSPELLDLCDQMGIIAMGENLNAGVKTDIEDETGISIKDLKEDVRVQPCEFHSTNYLNKLFTDEFEVVDLAGFPKQAYYCRKSQWSEDTMLHVFPHWNWQPGQKVDVRACYNYADEAELFLNGKSLGIRKKSQGNCCSEWRVKYRPGTLKVVSIHNGNVVAEKEIRTAGEPSLIRLAVEREAINANGKDLAFVTAEVTDKNGNLVPDAKELIKFSLDGEASIEATANGDPTNHDFFQCTQLKTFKGRCLTIVKAGKKKGSVMVKAINNSLPESKLRIDLE